jgi:hypothetical protein
MYATMIRMFDPDFVNNLRQAPRDNLCVAQQQTKITGLVYYVKWNICWGRAKYTQYSLIKVTHKKWLKNENDSNDNEYELPI